MQEITDRKIAEYAEMTPQKRQQELKGLFNLLPDSNLLRSEKGEYIQDPVTGETKHRDPEEFARKIQEINRRSKERLQSPLAESLRQRLSSLLAYTETTISFREYIALRYEEYLDLGIDREGFQQFKSSQDFWARILQWKEIDSAGPFSEVTAEKVDRTAYVDLRNQQLRDQRRQEQFNDPEYVRKFMGDKMADAIAQNPLKSKEEELANTNPDNPDHQGMRQMLEKSIAKEHLVRRWREEFIEKYGDEP